MTGASSLDVVMLDVVAAELCAVPPGDFMAARAAAASAHPTLAGAIRALRKPVVSAWAVDRLAASGALTDALSLAAELREAADDLDAAEMTRLSGQRRALVAALAKQAAEQARAAGVAVSAAALTDIERTIDAAVRDGVAATAVMSARLVKPLQANGIDPIDQSVLVDALAGSIPAALPVTAPPPADDLMARRARRAAERVLRDAERAAAAAARAQHGAASRHADARDRAARIDERVAGLRAELDRVEADAQQARAAEEVAATALAAATDALADADESVQRATQALGDAGVSGSRPRPRSPRE